MNNILCVREVQEGRLVDRTTLTGVGVTTGTMLENASSICSVDAASETVGRKGGVTSFR